MDGGVVAYCYDAAIFSEPAAVLEGYVPGSLSLPGITAADPGTAAAYTSGSSAQPARRCVRQPKRCSSGRSSPAGGSWLPAANRMNSRRRALRHAIIAAGATLGTAKGSIRSHGYRRSAASNPELFARLASSAGQCRQHRPDVYCQARWSAVEGSISEWKRVASEWFQFRFVVRGDGWRPRHPRVESLGGPPQRQHRARQRQRQPHPRSGRLRLAAVPTILHIPPGEDEISRVAGRGSPQHLFSSQHLPQVLGALPRPADTWCMRTATCSSCGR